MRIEEQRAAGASGRQIPVGADSQSVHTMRLEEGQVLYAQVLSAESGTALLKTQEGFILRAMLETDIPLTPGAQAILTVDEPAQGLPVLRLDPKSVMPQHGQMTGQLRETSAADKQIGHLLNQLARQNVPLSDNSMTYLRQVLDQNPGISPEKAVFITANQLTQSDARSLFDVSGKTARIIENMSGLIFTEMQQDENGRLKMPEIAETKSAPKQQEGPAEIKPFDRGNVIGSRKPVRIDAPAASKTDFAPAAKRPITGKASSAEAKSPAGPLQDNRETSILSAFMSLPHRSSGIKPVPDDASASLISAWQNGQDTEMTGSKNTDIPSRLFDLLKSLFAEITSGDSENGLRLKKAKDEMLFKLMLFREAIEQSDLDNKAQLREQTQKLLNNMKAVADINQFIYVQIPVTISDKNNIADMYIFRKKQRIRKLDPENVSILLALDLPDIGHVESLIGIKGKEVSLRFDVSNDEMKAAFMQSTTEIYKMLAEIGYKLVNISVFSGKEETRVETAMLYLIAHESGIPSGFDLTI
ncbi:MAG: flagellar hook-length control protein FliK [Clostridiales bacterium]|jgi:hypothetical protein|nr:flagellar hook-length control protein FliK [Clostridiales bacterium]